MKGLMTDGIPKTLNPKACIGSINSLVREFKTTLVHFYNQPCSIHLSAPFMTHLSSGERNKIIDTSICSHTPENVRGHACVAAKLDAPPPDLLLPPRGGKVRVQS